MSIRYRNVLIGIITLISILIIAFILNIKYNWVDTDIIKIQAIKSFDLATKRIPDNIKYDEKYSAWVLEAPDRSARMIWKESQILLELDAKPFIAAGLNKSDFTGGRIIDDKILIGEEKKEVTQKTMIESFEQMTNERRKYLGYHEDLGHFGVEIEKGNLFEWAKDLEENDKDIVFVLNPEIFIEAGVDPEKIQGWIFAKVKVMDENNKKIEVDKILKPFNI